VLSDFGSEGWFVTVCKSQHNMIFMSMGAVVVFPTNIMVDWLCGCIHLCETSILETPVLSLSCLETSVSHFATSEIVFPF